MVIFLVFQYFTVSEIRILIKDNSVIVYTYGSNPNSFSGISLPPTEHAVVELLDFLFIFFFCWSFAFWQ